MQKTSTWIGPQGEIPGTTCGLSDSGWVDMLLFKKWLFHHILYHAGSNRPLLLLLDGHSSHYNLEAVELARKNDVIIFTLVPHTTHEMQPLDTTVFGKRLVITIFKDILEG